MKKRLNINLKKVHEQVRPDESKKDFLLRQTSGNLCFGDYFIFILFPQCIFVKFLGKFLISDASHVIAIDCSTGTIRRGNGIVERFNRSFNFCCEKYAEIRRIEVLDHVDEFLTSL